MGIASARQRAERHTSHMYHKRACNRHRARCARACATARQTHVVPVCFMCHSATRHVKAQKPRMCACAATAVSCTSCSPHRKGRCFPPVLPSSFRRMLRRARLLRYLCRRSGLRVWLGSVTASSCATTATPRLRWLVVRLVVFWAVLPRLVFTRAMMVCFKREFYEQEICVRVHSGFPVSSGTAPVVGLATGISRVSSSVSGDTSQCEEQHEFLNDLQFERLVHPGRAILIPACGVSCRT